MVQKTWSWAGRTGTCSCANNYLSERTPKSTWLSPSSSEQSCGRALFVDLGRSPGCPVHRGGRTAIAKWAINLPDFWDSECELAHKWHVNLWDAHQKICPYSHARGNVDVQLEVKGA